MPKTPKYSRWQLNIAKCIILCCVSIPVGLSVAGDANGPMLSIAVVAVVALVVAATYELLAGGLARVIGMIFPPRLAPLPSAESGVDSIVPVQSIPSLRELAVGCAWYIGAGTLVWVVAGLIAVTRTGPHAAETLLSQALLDLTPIATPASIAASGLALVFTLRSMSHKYGAGPMAGIVGGTVGEWQGLVLGLTIGAALGTGIVFLSTVVKYQPDQATNLISQMVAASSAGRSAWAISVLLLAPPIEEAFFRGVLLGSLKCHWGVAVGVLVSGGLFWLLHGPEWVHYWPAALGIGEMTLVLSALRLRSGALGPAVAAHFAYNAALVIAVIL